MKLLTIDTCTSALSVALTDGERLLGEYLLNIPGTHEARLLALIDELLRDGGVTVADLDAIAIALGPGSFTGVRIGVATVKGLALAADKPVVGFSSLAMLAMNLPCSPYPVCPMFDARKREVYAALYRCSPLPRTLIPDCVTDPVRFLDAIKEPTVFLGDGAATYRELIEERLADRALFAPAPFNVPRASAGALLALDAFARGAAIPLADLNPVYIRPSEAELAKMRRELV